MIINQCNSKRRLLFHRFRTMIWVLIMYFPQHHGRVKFRFIPGYPLTGIYNPSAPWTWSGINQLYNKNFGPPVSAGLWKERHYGRKGIWERKGILGKGKVEARMKIQFLCNKNTFCYILYYKVLTFNSKISKIPFCGYIILLMPKQIPDWWKGEIAFDADQLITTCLHWSIWDVGESL